MHKVLHILQKDTVDAGGANRVAVELVKRLNNLGFNARILFLYGKEGPFGEVLKGKCDYLGLKSSREVWKYRLLKTYFKQEEPDVVHFHDDLVWPQVVEFRKRPWRTVIHAHNNGVSTPQIKTRLLYMLQKIHADHVFCINEEARHWQQKNVGFISEKLSVIRNGVCRNSFRKPKKEETIHFRDLFNIPLNKRVIGFVGRLHDEMKGCLDFIDLIHALPQEFFGLIAGGGPDGSKMRARATDLNVSDRVSFTGSLTDVRGAYNAIDVFVLLSRFEPFGLVVAEAFACEIPVIGFNCPGGVKDILNDNTGVIIDNRDIGAMARAVENAAMNGEDWQKKKKRALELIGSSYDWDDSAKAVAKVYNDLIYDKNPCS
jgi:glycosyltransferase involved in cell wall biosynthesis